MGFGSLAIAGLAPTILGDTIAIGSMALAGALGNSVGGQVGTLVEGTIESCSHSNCNKNGIVSKSMEVGFLDSDKFIWDVGSGAIFGATSQTISAVTRTSNFPKMFQQSKDIDRNKIKELLNKIDVKPILDVPNPGLMEKVSDVSHDIFDKASENIKKQQL